jgi:hypothetical protein
MPATRSGFSDAALTELLRALRARTSDHPDNPGLIASWPSVPEKRMAAACAELVRLGHPVYRVTISVAGSGRTREAWAVAATTDEPVLLR